MDAPGPSQPAKKPVTRITLSSDDEDLPDAAPPPKKLKPVSSSHGAPEKAKRDKPLASKGRRSSQMGVKQEPAYIDLTLDSPVKSSQLVKPTSYKEVKEGNTSYIDLISSDEEDGAGSSKGGSGSAGIVIPAKRVRTPPADGERFASDRHSAAQYHSTLSVSPNGKTPRVKPKALTSEVSGAPCSATTGLDKGKGRAEPRVPFDEPAPPAKEPETPIFSSQGVSAMSDVLKRSLVDLVPLEQGLQEWKAERDRGVPEIGDAARDAPVQAGASPRSAPSEPLEPEAPVTRVLSPAGAMVAQPSDLPARNEVLTPISGPWISPPALNVSDIAALKPSTAMEAAAVEHAPSPPGQTAASGVDVMQTAVSQLASPSVLPTRASEGHESDEQLVATSLPDVPVVELNATEATDRMDVDEQAGGRAEGFSAVEELKDAVVTELSVRSVPDRAAGDASVQQQDLRAAGQSDDQDATMAEPPAKTSSPKSAPTGRELEAISSSASHVDDSEIFGQDILAQASRAQSPASQATQIIEPDPDRITWATLSPNPSRVSSEEEMEVDELASTVGSQEQAPVLSSEGAESHAESQISTNAVVPPSTQMVPMLAADLSPVASSAPLAGEPASGMEEDSRSRAPSSDAATEIVDSADVMTKTRSASQPSSVDEPLSLMTSRTAPRPPPPPLRPNPETEAERASAGRFFGLTEYVEPAGRPTYSRPAVEVTDKLGGAIQVSGDTLSTCQSPAQTLLSRLRGDEPPAESSALTPVSANVPRQPAVKPSRKTPTSRRDVPHIVLGRQQPKEFDYSFHDAVEALTVATDLGAKGSKLCAANSGYTAQLFEAWMYERCSLKEPDAPPVLLRRAKDGRLVLKDGKAASSPHEQNPELLKDHSPFATLTEKDQLPKLDWYYTNRMVYSDELPERISQREGCGCVGVCKPDASCACAVRQRLAFISNSSVSTTDGGGSQPRSRFDEAPNFAYDSNGRLLLDTDPDRDHRNKVQCNDSLPIYECNSACKCSKECMNRVIGRGRKAELALAHVNKMGWGVFNAGTEDILPGDFIGHYSGEVLSADEAKYREQAVCIHDSSYVYDLDVPSVKPAPELKQMAQEGLVTIAESSSKALQERTQSAQSAGTSVSQDDVKFSIDARFFRNLTGFVNHRCLPNCHSRSFYTDDADMDRPGLAFFAQRVIKPGEQLFISYKGLQEKHEYLLDPPQSIYQIVGEHKRHAAHRSDADGKVAAAQPRQMATKKLPSKTAVIPPITATAASSLLLQNEVVYGNHGTPKRQARRDAEGRLEVLQRATKSWARGGPSSADNEMQSSETINWREQVYTIDRSGERTCFCGAPNCDWKMFGSSEEPSVSWEGSASAKAEQLEADDEGVHVRVIDLTTRQGDRYVLDQDATFANLIDDFCERNSLVKQEYLFKYLGQDVGNDDRKMAEVKPVEDVAVEYEKV